MKKPLWVIGIDEVGRGPLAGPVTVCAAAMPYGLYKKGLWKGLTDSKQMTAKAREAWYAKRKSLEAKDGVRYALASRTAAAIDSRGIAVCIRECVKACLKKFALDPADCLVLLDGGLRAPSEYVHQKTIIKGDSKEQIIALASVIAKVSRDAFMTKLDKKYPQYGWGKNKGYGTAMHRKLIQNKGISDLHRVSFLTRILDK